MELNTYRYKVILREMFQKLKRENQVEKPSLISKTSTKIRKHKKVVFVSAGITAAIMVFILVYPYTTPTYNLVVSPTAGQSYNYHFTITVKTTNEGASSSATKEYLGRINIIDVASENITFTFTVDNVIPLPENITENFSLPLTGIATVSRDNGAVVEGENIELLQIVNPTTNLPTRPVRTSWLYYHDIWSLPLDFAVEGYHLEATSISELTHVTDSEYTIKTKMPITMVSMDTKMRMTVNISTVLDRTTCIKKTETAILDWTSEEDSMKVYIKTDQTITPV